MRKVKAVIERAKDGTYSIYSDAEDLDYLVTATGKTVEQAQQNFRECYDEIKLYREETGKPFVPVEMVFTYDIGSFLAYYSKFITLAGLSRLTGINSRQLSHYTTGHRHPSPATEKKIIDAIHAFGQDLSSLPFA